MGILNLTPDSFYPESRIPSVDAALNTMQRFVEEGADYIDIGAESSRPGARTLSPQEELDRLLPVLETLVPDCPVPVSVDTCKPEVAEAVLNLGVGMINDITGLRNPDMAPVIARSGAGVIIMHMQGDPQTMQKNPQYKNVVADVKQYLIKAVTQAESAGVSQEKIVIDPGIGFGKTFEHNLELIQGLDGFKSIGKPLLLGVSRKSFIGQLLKDPEADRLEGSIAAGIMGVKNGARILRVHDVAATRCALDTLQDLEDKGTNS